MKLPYSKREKLEQAKETTQRDGSEAKKKKRNPVLPFLAPWGLLCSVV